MKYWVNQCLIANAPAEETMLTEPVLRYSQGDRNYFDNLMQIYIRRPFVF